MTKRQWIVVAALALITVVTFGVMTASVLRSLAQLSPPTSPLLTPPSQPIAELPTWSPTLRAMPTYKPTRTSSPTPTPRATSTPTSPPTSTSTPRPLSWIPTLTPASSFAATAPSGQRYGTLEDFWDGKASWAIQVHDVGLPVGESDTINMRGGRFWSYLNASYQSAGVVDQCGDPVPFPGCVTRWESNDGGFHFYLKVPVCLFPCSTCPCGPGDHVDQQQYPRVIVHQGQFIMAYEWGAGAFVRFSNNGVDWSGESQVPGTGIWRKSESPCNSEVESIGFHPNVDPREMFDCLAGAPPGIYAEGNHLYVFTGLGQAPSHMGCFVGDIGAPIEEMVACTTTPLFGGAREYGPLDAIGADGDAYFDYRTISSADVVREGEHYYMAYEGTRGPSAEGLRDDQFALGLARSVGPTIDEPWETYPGNPVIEHQGDNWGIGHADIVEVNGVLYLYTSTSPSTRGRYVLVYK